MKRWIPFLNPRPVVAVIRLSGMIAAGGRGALNDEKLAPIIEKAFARKKPAAVALVINSPGGSPVQSSLIAARIRRLADEKEIPVIAFVEDVAASGGYWLACSADEIIIDSNSVVGSIGVISSGFGLDELISRHGISRRVHTAGKSKSLLDPFQPEKPEDIEKLRAVLVQIHDSFINHVKNRRESKLDQETDLFTGDIWVGEKAVELGLADSIGHLVPVLKERFGDKTRFAQYSVKRGFFRRFGASITESTIDHLEERAQFARFGL